MKRIFDVSIIKSKFFIVMMIMIVMIHALIFFPTVRFNDTSILLFAFDRLGSWHTYTARVMGNHILETEHGEIRLGRFSRIQVSGNSFGIKADNFENGRASHNIVVEGIIIPQSARISFDGRHQVSVLTLYLQDVIVSGIPFAIADFQIRSPREIADISMTVGRTPEYITLADYTQIFVDPARWLWGGLFFYNDAGVWVLREVFNGFMVKRPGETEFTRYRSITFRPDWGEFIEGVRWE